MDRMRMNNVYFDLNKKECPVSFFFLWFDLYYTRFAGDFGEQKVGRAAFGSQDTHEEVHSSDPQQTGTIR